ncbi:MAG: PAS domain-containing sensor histidine kinase [Mariniphaga sp.]
MITDASFPGSFSNPSAKMPDGNGLFSDKAMLHQKAEKIWSEKASGLKQKIMSGLLPDLLIDPSTSLPVKAAEAEILKMICVQEIYALELEMQNNELLLAYQQISNDFKRYLELFDLAPSGYFVLSKESQIFELNLAGAQLFGNDPTKLKNQRFDIFISEDSKPVFNLFLADTFSGKVKAFCEVTCLSKSKFPAFVILTGILSENEEHCHVTAVDISDRKIIENAIRLKNEELIANNTEKDKFFSVLAHDLRGPFSGFLGLTELMADGLPVLSPDEIQQMAFLMRKSAANIFQLLGNLLEWSSMQRGLVVFVPKFHFLRQKVAESMNLVIDAASKKRIAVNYEIDEYLMVFADENMLDSIIRNLAMNAVKFTPAGGNITISAKTNPDNSVEIAIKDTGIGINEVMLGNLFRLDVNTNRQGTEGESSTGMGLFLCNDFVKKHNGKLWVESQEGKGSTFRFSFPLKWSN